MTPNNDMNRRRAMATGGLTAAISGNLQRDINSLNNAAAPQRLADAFAANPMQRGAPTPQQAAMMQRSRQASASNQRIPQLFAAQADGIQDATANYTSMANGQRVNLHNHMAQAGALGQRAASPQGYTDRYNVTTRRGVATPGPSLPNLPEYVRPPHTMPSIPARFDEQGNRVNNHAQGVTLDMMFPSPGDSDRRAKFEAARGRRADRREQARAMRQEQLAGQRQAAVDAQQNMVINPFMNPMAMRAMQMNPELAMAGVNSLNDALQGRARLQNEKSATVADFGLRNRAQSLDEVLGVGGLQIKRDGQVADSRYRDAALDAENAYRTRQNEIGLMDAQTGRMTAEAAKRESDAKMGLMTPEAIRRQEMLEEFEMISQTPGMEDEASDLYQQIRGVPGSVRPPTGPVSKPLVVDRETKDFDDEAIDRRMRELYTNQGLRGPDLAAALEGEIGRERLLQFNEQNGWGAGRAIGDAFDITMSMPWNWPAEKRRVNRRSAPYESLSEALE